MVRVIAPVEPETLVWARKTAGYKTARDAAEKISWLKDKEKNLRQWESGEKISLSNAKKLAKSYHRSVPFFYLPLDIAKEDEHKEPIRIKDFRKDDVLGPKAIRFLRDVRSRQEWASTWLMESQSRRPDWLGTIQISRGANVCANFLRDRIWTKPDRPSNLNNWIEQAEENLGVLVMQSRPTHRSYHVEESFSGCALLDKWAPVVALNYKQNEGRRLFTLLHELAHLCIGQEGISNIEFRIEDSAASDPVETFCDKVAAETLMPESIFRESWTAQGGDIDRQVARFGASHSACIVRAARLGLMDGNIANQKLRQIKAARSKAKEASQGKQGEAASISRHPHAEAISRCGSKLSRHILESYNTGAITAVEVSDLFDVNLKHLADIGKKSGVSLPRWGT